MKVDLSNYEIYDLLRNGSTNQKHFVNQINKFNLNVDDLFDEIENIFIEYEIEYDIRDLINGGVLYLNDTASKDFLNFEIKNGVYLIIE